MAGWLEVDAFGLRVLAVGQRRRIGGGRRRGDLGPWERRAGEQGWEQGKGRGKAETS